jgi:hypothetical protein
MGSTAILLGKTPATNVSCSSTRDCTATTPAVGKPTTVDVVVIVGRAKSKKTSNDHYTLQ